MSYLPRVMGNDWKKNVTYLPELLILIDGLNINFYTKIRTDLLKRKMQIPREI